MKTTQLTPFEQVREEFCSRYGLNPEQVSFEVRLNDVEKPLAAEIAKDYGNKYDYIENIWTTGTSVNVDNKHFGMWIHFPKEGADDAES